MRSRLVIMIAVIAVSVFGGYGITRYWSTAEKMIPEVEKPTETAHLIDKTVKEDTEDYVINLKYPNFGLVLIDAAITKKINAAVVQFRVDGADGPARAAPYDLSSVYDSTYIGDDFVSARLAVSSYLGGAHPNTWIVGLNFDRESGRELVLEDALQLIGRSLGEVAAMTKRELSKKLDDAFFPEGVLEKPENYETFIVNADSVIFIFQEYQAGPYSSGAQEVAFPRK